MFFTNNNTKVCSSFCNICWNTYIKEIMTHEMHELLIKIFLFCENWNPECVSNFSNIKYSTSFNTIIYFVIAGYKKILHLILAKIREKDHHYHLNYFSIFYCNVNPQFCLILKFGYDFQFIMDFFLHFQFFCIRQTTSSVNTMSEYLPHLLRRIFSYKL